MLGDIDLDGIGNAEDVYRAWRRAAREFAQGGSFVEFAQITARAANHPCLTGYSCVDVMSLQSGIDLAENSARVMGYQSPLNKGAQSHIEKTLLYGGLAPYSFQKVLEATAEKFLKHLAEELWEMNTEEVGRELIGIKSAIDQRRRTLGY